MVSPFWQFAAKNALRYACNAKIDIAEDRRDPTFKAQGDVGLFIANHQSYMDIPMIVTMYQVPPIMKKEVLYVPFVGLLGWICGAMPVSRSSMGSKRKIIDQTRNRILKDKMGIQVYPEGTRSKDSHPKPYEEIKRALMVIAYSAKIPIIPTSVYGTRGIVSRLGFFNSGRHLGIIVHKEILPENFKSSDEFCRACWEKVVEGYEEMALKLDPANKSLS